jgi:methylase of polypeptide subunit release factors
MYVQFSPPPYKLWPYERELRLRELGVKSDTLSADDTITISAQKNDYSKYKRLVFSHSVKIDGFASEPTWQAAIENGGASCPSARKDPKYVTHGIHPYKGKFYPQLAKGLLNLADLSPASVILDPFCGSGTTLLEGYLNGHKAYGCDMNPLAAKIARAKVAVLEVDNDVLSEVVTTVREIVSQPPLAFPKNISHLSDDCMEEIKRWFAVPVIYKLDWLIGQIRRASAGATLDFLEVILSSIIRDISHQDPSDLRVRFRKDLLLDADVIGMFSRKLDDHFEKVEKFWKVRGSAPHAFFPVTITEGDNRNRSTFDMLDLKDGSVDLVLTSPPYGTALPYIDTDRLSLLTLMGYTSAQRRPVESGLIGSREIGTVDRRRLEDAKERAPLPKATRRFLTAMTKATASDVNAGCRKQNAPALMTRYLLDMKAVIDNAFNLLKPNGEIMMVIGDNRTELNGKSMRVPCTDMVEEIALQTGFVSVERIDIAVTTENLRHMKNAILENVVLRLKKPN